MENPFAKYVQDNPSVASENPFAKYTAEQQSPQAEAQAAPEEKTSVADYAMDIGRGVVGGIPKIGSGLISGGSILAGGLAHAVGANEIGDTIFRDMDSMNQSIDQFTQENLPTKTKAGNIAKGVTQVAGAMINPVTGAVAASGLTQQGMADMMNQGVDPQSAADASRIQMVANMVLGSFGSAGVIQSYLKSAGLNVGTGAAANWLTQKYLENNGYKKQAGQYDPTDAENWMVDFLASLVGTRAHKAGASKGSKNDAAIDAELAKAGDDAPKPAAPPAVPATPETPLPTDIPFNEIKRPPLSDVPRLPEQPAPQGETPLPIIRELPTDTVPYLPGTEPKPAPQPPLPGVHPTLQTPPPVVPKPVRGALPTVEGMADLPPLLPETKPDLPIQNLEPPNPFLPGTAPVHVPTMDTPLPTIDPRMVGELRPAIPEVPKVKEALPRFADRYAKAKSEAGRNKVEQDFMKFLKQNGVDADTASKLFHYEVRNATNEAFKRAVGKKQGGWVDPFGQRRGSEAEANRALGDRAVPGFKTAGGTSMSEWASKQKQDAARRALLKKQGGAIHPDLLGLGKASDILGRLGSQALWNRFRGTFRAELMDDLKSEATGYKSRSTAVWMSPDDFRALARQRPKGDVFADHRMETKRESIRQGLKTDEGLQGKMPFLWIEKDGDGYARVVGHEGRHRSDVFSEQGVDLMPVEIRDLSGNRWDTDGNPYHSLVSEESVDGPSVNRPFPNLFIFEPPGKWKHEGLQDTVRGALKNAIAGSEMSLAEWNRLGNATKQGGGINVQDITQGVSNLVKASKGIMKNPAESMAEEALPDRQRAAASKVPGYAALKDYISKDIDPAYIIEKIKALGDIKNSYHGLIGSKEMIASIKDHPAIYWIASRFTNARKRADLYHREYLKPLETTILKMTQDKEGAQLAHVMKKEMFAKKRLDDDALRRIGLSDREIQAYNDLQTQFDAAFERLNAFRVANGEEALTRHQAYLSSRWSGDWKTPVFKKIRDENGNIKLDKDGKPELKLVWYIAETSKAKAEHALKWLQKNEPDLDFSKSKVKYSKDFFFAEESMSMSKYADMVRMLGKNDPAVRAMEEYNNQRLAGEGETLLGHNKHFEPKSGVRGFQGDRPWVNDQNNTRDLLKAQLAYLRNTHTWVEMQKAIDDTNKILVDKDVQEVAPNLIELMQDLKRAEVGSSTLRGLGWMERKASQGLGEVTSWMGKLFPPIRGLSTDLASINQGMGLAKAYFYTMKLGMVNIPFATMSLVQPIFTIPHHVQLSGAGYDHNFLKTWVDVMSGVGGATKAYHTGDLGWLTGIQKEAYKYMKANGIGDLSQYDEAHAIGMPYMAERAKHYGGMSMTSAERLSRTMAFMGYVSHLDQSGKFKGRQMEMFQLAETLTDKSMANYRHTERAGVFNKAGFVGNAAATLQTFKINQLNQMYDFAKYAKRTGDYKPIAAMIMTQWLMAGAMGMYGLDEIEDMWNLLKKGLVELGVADKELLAWSPKKMMADNLPEWAAYGIPSSVHNRNWSNRMSQANIADLTFAGMFPFLADYGKQISAFATVLKDAAMGHSIKESGERAIHAALPSSMKSYYEMHSGLTDAEGNPYPTTKAPRQLQYRRTEEDKEAKDQMLWGMQSLDEAKGRASEFQLKQYQGNVTRLQQVLATDFEDSLREGNYDLASKTLLKYVEADGNWKALIKQIPDDVMKTMMTEEEWQFLKAMDGKQAMKTLIRRLEFKGVR